MSKGLRMKAGNKGLTVKLNFWPRNEMKGQLVHADTQERVWFNSSEELISVLTRWNEQKHSQTENP